MKKHFLLLTLVALIALLVIGCNSNNNTKPVDDSGNANQSSSITENAQPETNETSEDMFWQQAYALFLRDYPVTVDDDDQVDCFFLRDMDNSGVPELLIVQMNGLAMDAVLSVYAYDNDVNKIGDYTNPEEKFLGGFRFSNNPMYPGLFDQWWGGGMEHYGYISVKDGKLISEHLWFDNKAVEPPHQEIISTNQQLVEEAVRVFPSNENSDNLVELHIINDENIAAVLLSSP
ncbi:MAG: hypothetical protein FWD21_04715 [Peptococcaceae bacterium]|nr:hypothetical protein [Peptococcaceae bacterium]